MSKKKISEKEIEDNQAAAPLVIEEAPQKSKLSLNRHRVVYLAMSLAIVLCVIGMAFLYVKLQNSNNKSFSMLNIGGSNNNNKELVDTVSRIVDLPVNETPTIATVSDISKLSTQPFFDKAQNGDKVLIYAQAKEAVLYRPSDNKVINIGPINETASLPTSANTLGATTSSASTVDSQISPTPVKEPKVAILNGTKISGLAKTAQSKLAGEGLSVNVISRGNTINDYNESTIVDLTGKNTQVAQKISSTIRGKIGPLPSGETSVEGADIIIILGQNFAN